MSKKLSIIQTNDMIFDSKISSLKNFLKDKKERRCRRCSDIYRQFYNSLQLGLKVNVQVASPTGVAIAVETWIGTQHKETKSQVQQQRYDGNDQNHRRNPNKDLFPIFSDSNSHSDQKRTPPARPINVEGGQNDLITGLARLLIRLFQLTAGGRTQSWKSRKTPKTYKIRIRFGL